MKKFFAISLAMFCLFCANTPLQGAEKSDFEQELENLKKRVAELEKESKTSPSTSKGKQSFSYGYDNGFFLRASDLEIKLSGYIQMGLGIFETSTADNNSIYPNGVYLTTDVYYKKNIHGRIQVDFAANHTNFQGGGFGNPVLRDAFVEYIFRPELAFRAGNTHVPFSIEGQYGENQGVGIWGAPFISSWSHGRDPGLMVYGTMNDILDYQLSLHNGEGSGTFNRGDDFLTALGFRFYPFQKSKNGKTFFHGGLIASRDGLGNRAALVTPWGRNTFDPAALNDRTKGWRLGADVGFSFEKSLSKILFLRLESEFMYITWQRKYAAGLPNLEGFGFSLGGQTRYNLTPDVEGAGVVIAFQLSYSQVDNVDTDSLIAGAAIPGQRIRHAMVGLGYAFNQHFLLNFNWIFISPTEKSAYGGPKTSGGVGDDLEQAWFFQATLAW